MKTELPTAIAELRGWPRWVLWRTEERDGKPTKVPYQTHRPTTRASSTDAGTWGSYEEAAKALERGRCDGIGYVFAADDEYTGIDLDHCIINGRIHFGARQIVDRLASYTELSPSGTGLHIIIRGRLNGGRNRTSKTAWPGGIEMYDQARFFTVTGNHLDGTPTTIEARQDELDALRAELFPAPNGKQNGSPLVVPARATSLDDVALEEKIRKSKQGPKFAELFDRGAPEGQESEADLSLCNILAFWVGPSEAEMDRWFRRSALMRDKWDDRRGETTYGGYTINRALEGRTEFYNQKTTPKLVREHDDPELTPGEEMSGIFGLIDDPFVHGWRPMRSARSRVVLTTRSGKIFDVDSWKAATGSPPVLAQEIAFQLKVEVTLTKQDLSRLNVLVGSFCDLVEASTVVDRARQIGEEFLQESTLLALDFNDPQQRGAAFKEMKNNKPAVRAKVESVSFAEACITLADSVTGKRYVRIQWFVDHVKQATVSGTAGDILKQMEAPGWWSRRNGQGRWFAPDPDGGPRLSQILFEVPRDWEGSSDTP